MLEAQTFAVDALAGETEKHEGVIGIGAVAKPDGIAGIPSHNCIDPKRIEPEFGSAPIG